MVQAPGGGFNPEFNNIFASNLGFGPPPPGAMPMPPQQQQQPDYAGGRFDLGGGQQLRVKINGQTPENYVKNRVSGMIWGWIIGLIILAIVVLGGIGLGIYIYFQAKDGMTAGTGTGATPLTTTWDGKTPLSCSGNDSIAVSGVTASAGVIASANCHVALVNVNITTPMGINAGGNATVTMTGGSVNSASGNAVIASANAKVVFAGTKVSGKVVKSGNAQVVGAP